MTGPPADRSAIAWRWTAVVGLYVVACRVMLAPIFNFAHPATANYEGDTRLIIWTLAWDNHALLDRVPSLFDANIFYPAHNALGYSEHLFGISLFSLPVYWLTRNPVLAYNVVWLLAFLLSALAAHALAWRYTHDHVASFVAGAAFAFCFFRMHHGHGHLHMVWAFWIPLSLVAMDRWTARPTWPRAFVFVGVVTLQALASWYQAVLIFIADGLFLLWVATGERRFGSGNGEVRFRRFAVHAIVGAAVALACVWPFARHYGVLSAATPLEASGNAADFAGFLVPPENTIAGQWLLVHGIKGPRWIWGEQTVYLGWITILLAVIGAGIAVVARSERLRAARFFILLGALAVAFAVGPSQPEIAANRWGFSPFGVLMHLPDVSLFRAPARFVELLTLALAILAAIASAQAHRRWGTVGRVVTVVVIPLMLAESYVVKFPGGAPQPFPIPKLYRQLSTLSAGAIVSLPDYAGTSEWYVEPDYQYFSTAHWRPIANGYSRAEPPGFRERMDRIKTFPAETSITALRDSDLRLVVVHAAAWPGGRAVVEAARASAELRLAARNGEDYLFEVVGER